MTPRNLSLEQEPPSQSSRVIYGRVEKRPEPAPFRPAWMDGPAARCGSLVKPRVWQTIDLGYEIPFTSIPSIIEEGFRAEQDRVMKRGEEGLAEHYQIARNCLLEYREAWFCDVLLMLVLTVFSSCRARESDYYRRATQDGPQTVCGEPGHTHALVRATQRVPLGEGLGDSSPRLGNDERAPEAGRQ
jgi:hypothetical protein